MGSHFFPLGNLPDPGLELGSPALEADSLLSEPPGKPQHKILDTSEILLASFRKSFDSSVLQSDFLLAFFFLEMNLCYKSNHMKFFKIHIKSI